MTEAQINILRRLRLGSVMYLLWSDAEWANVVAMGKVGLIWWDEVLIKITAKGREALEAVK